MTLQEDHAIAERETPARHDGRSQRPAKDRVEREALLRVAAAAAGASGLDDVLELAAEEARDAVGAASLSVSRWERDFGRVRTMLNVGDLGPGEERYPEDEFYEVGGYPNIDELLRSGRSYFNVLGEDGCDAAAGEILRRLHKSSDVGVAITVEGETWGEIWATKAIGARPFRATDIAFLEAIAGQFATAIARAELFSRVSRLAYEDPLTALPNRRALEERLQRAFDRAHTPPIAMLICDLDGLKSINDTAGHDAGDRTLTAVAEALVAAAADRPGAFVARLAGDEFCVLLEGLHLADAVGVGEAAIALLSERSVPISVSCGAAVAGDNARSSSDLFKAADTALYVAKRRGGTNVCSSPEALSETPRPESVRVPDESSSEIERIGLLAASLTEQLDDRLQDAPVLDRLEAVATALTRVGNFAAWTISFAAAGTDVLVDASVGDNRAGSYHGVRVSPGFEQYRLSDFPATEAIVRRGSGSLVVSTTNPEHDPCERTLLAELGFACMAGAVSSGPDGSFLLELFGDPESMAAAAISTPLRLLVTAAVQAPASHRHLDRAGRAGERVAVVEAVARRVGHAETLEEVAEATIEEVDRAYGCMIAQLVRKRPEGIELVAESESSGTAAQWPQEPDSGLIGRCLRDGRPVLVGDVTREPQYRAANPSQDIRAELTVPIFVADSLWGAVNFEDPERDRFGTADVISAEAVAAVLGLAIDRLSPTGRPSPQHTAETP